MDQTIQKLLHEVGLEVPSTVGKNLVTGVTTDSRQVKDGNVFIGLPGENFDGGNFWPQALSSGAVLAIIGSEAAKNCPPSYQDAVLVAPDPVAICGGNISAAFWEHPSEKISLIGVTGTNGKTTITHLIEHLISSLGKKTALYGTLFNRWPLHSSTATNTTSFCDVLQANLASAVRAGAEFGTMEVSSHALHQHRVAGCIFSGAVFTNLTQDHLDYHSSMEEYFETKSLLFCQPLLKEGLNRAVVNTDDLWGARLAKRLGDKCWRCSIVDKSSCNKSSELTISEISMCSGGVKGVLSSPLGRGAFFSPLVGRFNVMNLLQSVGVLIQQGFPFDDLLEAIPTFSGVPGRMEKITIGQANLSSELPLVIVDYAHTPDGLKNALFAARSLTIGKLICVFGCGGDRDRGKRPQMGQIASELADFVVLTSDNPRKEDPDQIFKDVLNGIPISTKMVLESNRSLAIQKTIVEANSSDVILIAGKGHENYQIIGSNRLHFDDREQAKDSLRKRLNR